MKKQQPKDVGHWSEWTKADAPKEEQDYVPKQEDPDMKIILKILDTDEGIQDRD